MDMTMVDLSALPGIGVGSELEIFGGLQPVDKLAALLGTIPYELPARSASGCPGSTWREAG